MKKLKYVKLADSVLSIDLLNGYTIIAMKSYNYEKKNYDVKLYIKDNTVETLELIEQQEKIEFNADNKNINTIILKYVASLLSEGHFDYYINRYTYMIKCFEKGNALFEKEQLAAL